VTSLLPIDEVQVRVAIENILKAVPQNVAINSNCIHGDDKGDPDDPSKSQEDIANKLAVLSSLIEAINTPSIITRLTLIIQKVQTYY
jgi:hypothetical protein